MTRASPPGQSARYESEDEYLRRKARERKQKFEDADRERLESENALSRMRSEKFDI